MDKYFILIRKNHCDYATKDIDENLFYSLSSEYDKILAYKMLMIHYCTYHEALESLKVFIEQNPISPIERTSLRIFAIPNSFVGNCLSAFYSFVEFCSQNFIWFNNDINDESGNIIKALSHEIYDNNFSYKLIYNLRTYSTHHNIPIMHISMQLSPDGKSWTNPIFCANKDEIKQSKEIQSGFKAEFDSTIQDKEFDIYPFLAEVDTILACITNRLILNEEKEINEIFDHFNSFASPDLKNTDIGLWENTDEKINLTSSIYCLYLNFIEGMQNNVYCLNNNGSGLTNDVNDFLLELKSKVMHH